MRINKNHISLVLAVIFASLSSFGVYGFLKERESVSIATPAAATVPVIVAKTNLTLGDKLTEAHLTVQQWPQEANQGDYFHHAKSLVGRTVRSNITAGEPFAESKLLEPGENISSLIPPHMRGITVTVPKSGTLARALEKGSRVDVVAVLDNIESSMNAKVIAQRLLVLSVSDLFDEKGNENHKTMEVMLLAKPSDANWIIYARNHGVIELVVSNEKGSEVFIDGK